MDLSPFEFDSQPVLKTDPDVKFNAISVQLLYMT